MAKARSTTSTKPKAASGTPSTGVSLTTLLVVVGASTLSSVLVMGVLVALLFRSLGGPINPAPVDVDPAFVALGETYAPELLKTYSESWRSMADRVDSGRPIGEAVTAFSADWTARRNELFDKQLAGPFKALVPEGATEDQITHAQRRAYAAAARGVAEGLAQ